MKAPSKASLERAVKAAQLYAGAICADIKVAQKLYNKAKSAAFSIARTTGMDPDDVLQQISDEASRRGAICPIPGKDY